jgi:hypothetical protein
VLPHCALSKINLGIVYFLPVFVCDKALPAMLFTVLEVLELERAFEALLATDFDVCFLFI